METKSFIFDPKRYNTSYIELTELLCDYPVDIFEMPDGKIKLSLIANRHQESIAYIFTLLGSHYKQPLRRIKKEYPGKQTRKLSKAESFVRYKVISKINVILLMAAIVALIYIFSSIV